MTVTIRVANGSDAVDESVAPPAWFWMRWWWRTMPVWLRVNDVNTPTAYSGMRALVRPSKATMSTPAVVARKTMPFEKTSRSPRLAN